ncbi:MAG: glycosyltransferase family 4 protein [Burkholderiales bacterium]|nr:glycosyltransferase family 4 protein [Burkholderiales bacterium]
MKILILSFYYEPDLSAGSFRTTALVRALLEILPGDAQIEVITTMPNRYSSFTATVPESEQFDRLTIRRISIPAHRSGMLDQSKAFLAFAFGALRLVRSQRYDLVYATSSRLMTAVLGSVIARWRRSRLYVDIRDIFVDTINDVLSRKVVFAVRPMMSGLERFALTRAQKVNLVSEGFLDYFQHRYPQLSYSFHTNGVDPEFINAFAADEAAAMASAHEPITVLYAGNMGEGQGLHAIIPNLAKKMDGRVRFRLIGDGGRRAELERAILANGSRNVEVLNPVSRGRLVEEYRKADVLFLHLNDYDAFKKVLPSKIFEYAATGKPIWAGVAGFAAQFLIREVENAVVFKPCNVDDAERSFSRLNLQFVSRKDFVGRFSRESISRDIAKDMLCMLGKND